MRVPAAKTAAGTALVLMLLAAASYAAVRPGAGGGAGNRAAATTPLPARTSGSAALHIVTHPAAVSARLTARFQVAVAGEPPLRCRLDHRRARPCGPTITYRRLRPGRHTFSVRALQPGAAPLRAGFAWTILEPRPFTISPRPAAIGALYPGAAAIPIPVVVTNPNPIPIIVTSLQVSATGGAPGCEPAANLALTVPDLGTGKLRLPAHGSVSLPSAAAGAPTIALRDLPVDQDACQGASFDLAFSGSAGG